MRARFHAAFALVLLGAAWAAGADTKVATLGKQRAAASLLKWEVREAGHPVLGPIVFAVLGTPVFTTVGSAAVSSNVYVSCERSTAKIAIELANGRRVDDPLGLKPKSMPRLTCNTVALADGRPATEPLDATWTVNELGDVMARGLWPSTLRACASIGISEEVLVPKEWGRESVPVSFEITPYARELDSVFARCGEPTAYASASEAPPATASSAPRAAVATTAPRAAAPTNGWSVVRVTSEGHTNVRAKPTTRSPVVIRLDPGDVLLGRKAEGDWWQVKSRPTAKVPFEGYIRVDRLVLR
jgi:hypothetical protein